MTSSDEPPGGERSPEPPASEPGLSDSEHQDALTDEGADTTAHDLPPVVITAGLSATIPADWYYKEQMTFLAPDGQANIIASTEPLDPSIELDDYVKAQGDILQNEFPEYQEYGVEPMICFGGLNGILRVFSWTPPDGVEVRQMQIYAVVNCRGCTATATVPEQELNRYRSTLGTILTLLDLRERQRPV